MGSCIHAPTEAGEENMLFLVWGDNLCLGGDTQLTAQCQDIPIIGHILLTWTIFFKSNIQLCQLEVLVNKLNQTNTSDIESVAPNIMDLYITAFDNSDYDLQLAKLTLISIHSYRC